MRIDELEEAEVKKAVFTFGRLNPPHYGHHALIQTLQKTAEKQGCDWFLFVSSKTGDEKNPLTYEQKVWWIQALFPETKGHLVIDPSIKTPLVAATWLYKKGYHAATFVAGEDDMASYGEMIKSGNAHGIKNPDSVRAGKGFVFEPLDFAISPRLASATNARKNVTDDDPEAFVRSILGPKINPKMATLVHDQLFPTIRKALGLTEYEEVSEAKKSNWEKMATPFKGTSKDLDKSDERAQQHLQGLKKAAADYQAIIDREKKKADESAELNKHTPSVSELAKKYATDRATVHKELAKGVKVEYEHTNDIDVATEIAMDHLGERIDYYDLLDKLEKSPKKKIGENFADGKGPGKPGDSQRHGIPKGATIAELEKAAKATGRKGQLARWQLNMRRGKKKANEEITNEEKKPKKPKTIIDGALKTLIAKGRSEDEAIADLKKEIDSKFYDLDENWSPMELAIMEGGHLLDDYEYPLEETLKKVKGKWALVSRHDPKKVLQYYHGSQHPSKEWVSKVERRVHSFESIVEDEETVKPRVYLDMDGVLADFFGEWSRISGVDHYKDIDDVEAKLQLVRDHPTFWIDLPMLPHAKALIKTVVEQYGEYRICSKPLEGDARSKSGKLQWIKTHLSDMPPAEIILTAEKADYATNDGIPNVLVDDFGKNINAWRAAGGIGIKYEDDSFPQVAKILTSVAKSGVKK
jgi:5'-nucleotidase